MTPLPSPRHCPECGATDRLAAERCWMCGARLREPAGQAQSPFAAEATSATFSLSSLFLVMTLVAVGAGVFAAAPGLGVLFLIVATPALVRTMVITSRQKSHGVATTPAEKFVAFLGSTGVVLLIFLSIGAALFTACWTACAGGAALSAAGEGATITGAIAGGVAGLALSGWVLWRIWHRQNKA